jgi:phage gpG-like protein
MFSVTIEDGGLLQRLDALAFRAENLSSEMQSIGEMIIRDRLETFQLQGRPEAWVQSKAAMKEGRKTLIKTGALMESDKISSVGSDHVEVTTGEGLGMYPVYLQKGIRYKKVGFRRWLHVQLQDSTVLKIMQRLSGHLLQGESVIE